MRRPDLVPDCGACAAICCTATSFEASEDFALTKPAGARCPYLRRDCRCAIHAELVGRGFGGCAAYECYGAGPRATRTFAGAPPAERDAGFGALRAVHELLWLTTEAAKLCPPSHPDVAGDLAREISVLDRIAAAPLAELLATDLGPITASARAVLRRVGDALGGRGRVTTPVRALARLPAASTPSSGRSARDGQDEEAGSGGEAERGSSRGAAGAAIRSG